MKDIGTMKQYLIEQKISDIVDYYMTYYSYHGHLTYQQLKHESHLIHLNLDDIDESHSDMYVLRFEPFNGTVIPTVYDFDCFHYNVCLDNSNEFRDILYYHQSKSEYLKSLIKYEAKHRMIKNGRIIPREDFDDKLYIITQDGIDDRMVLFYMSFDERFEDEPSDDTGYNRYKFQLDIMRKTHYHEMTQYDIR